MTCRERKVTPKIEEIYNCCDVELIRDTFKKSNCKIVYLNDLKYMLELDNYTAIKLFSKMVVDNNIAIIETIDLPRFCYILNILSHLGFNVNSIRTYDDNIIIYKESKNAMITNIYSSEINVFEGFMECLKLPNKKMCDICNCKKKCFRQCTKCKNKMCVECFKNHNK